MNRVELHTQIAAGTADFATASADRPTVSPADLLATGIRQPRQERCSSSVTVALQTIAGCPPVSGARGPRRYAGQNVEDVLLPFRSGARSASSYRT